MADQATGSTGKPMTAGEWAKELQRRHPSFEEVTATYRTWDDLHHLTPTDERTDADG
ncbi:MAG TPA: hypothetical protein VNL97_05560 [Solirubrobacterales bacterium]|nr:hypothetical protein [Solirubrobacterales bacterium]